MMDTISSPYHTQIVINIGLLSSPDLPDPKPCNCVKDHNR